MNVGESDGLQSVAVMRGGDDIAAEIRQKRLRAEGSFDERLDDGRFELGEAIEEIPNSIPKHGLSFLLTQPAGSRVVEKGVSSDGPPDLARFAKFLKDTYATPEVVVGSLDMQCPSCAESSKGFALSRSAAIHDDIGFDGVVGLDVVVWTNASGIRFLFVRC